MLRKMKNPTVIEDYGITLSYRFAEKIKSMFIELKDMNLSAERQLLAKEGDPA